MSSSAAHGTVTRRGRGPRLADLPLVWKLLLPSVVLTLVVGVIGTFAVVRYLAEEAQADLDIQLTRAAVGAEVGIAEETDYLLETSRVLSHVEGIEAALDRRELDTIASLLSESAAIRSRADLFVATDSAGVGLVELRRSGEEITRQAGTGWAGVAVVDRVLAPDVADVGDESVGLLLDGPAPLLVVAAPILDDGSPRGAAIVGTTLSNLASRVSDQVGAPVAIYGSDGSLVATTHPGVSARRTAPSGGRTVRENGQIGGEAVSTFSAPFTLRGVPAGVVSVTLPRDATLGSLWGVGARVGGVILLAMLIVMAVGIAIARLLLRRVRELVAVHRALASGRLETRAPVSGRDELGELAAGLNDMAEQLEASYRELERRVAERTDELQHLYDESVRAAEARGEFFAAISHELRTPLFVIAGHAELMLHPEMHPNEAGWEQEFGQAIHGSAQDLLARVNDILDLAKLETAELTLDLASVSVDDRVRDVVAEMAPLARQGKLTLTADIEAELPLVRADPARLSDILRNLVANAIKYTPAGGEARIRAARGSKGRVELSVTDTGLGIPEEAHDHLFEPFYQVPGARALGRQASTGLGLAVARRLVEAHGGTIWLHSKVGEGSTFAFTIPVARTPRTRAVTPPSSNGDREPPPVRRARRQPAKGAV